MGLQGQWNFPKFKKPDDRPLIEETIKGLDFIEIISSKPLRRVWMSISDSQTLLANSELLD